MQDRSEVPCETRQPFELSDELAKRVDELGLATNLDELRDEGYTIARQSADYRLILRTFSWAKT